VGQLRALSIASLCPRDLGKQPHRMALIPPRIKVWGVYIYIYIYQAHTIVKFERNTCVYRHIVQLIQQQQQHIYITKTHASNIYITFSCTSTSTPCSNRSLMASFWPFSAAKYIAVYPSFCGSVRSWLIHKSVCVCEREREQKRNKKTHIKK
jgi:hypothetical protein